MLNKDEIINKIKNVLVEENIKYDAKKLDSVVEYCMLAYNDKQKLNSSIMEHVIGVAVEVAKLRIDDVSIYASLLHEVVNIDGYDTKKLRSEFGDEIVDIVETIKKLSCLNIKNKEHVDSDTLRSMFLSVAKDIRTVIIKLADRLYNMKNIFSIEKEEIGLVCLK